MHFSVSRVHALEVSRTNQTGVAREKWCHGSFKWLVTFTGHDGEVPNLIPDGSQLNSTSAVDNLSILSNTKVEVDVVHPGYDANMKLEHTKVSFAASLGAVNRAFSSLVFTPPPFYHGNTSEIAIKVVEMARSGHGNAKHNGIAIHKIAVTVAKSKVAPTLDIPVRYLSVPEDHELSIPGVVLVTPHPDEEVLTMTLSAEAGTMFARPIDSSRIELSPYENSAVRAVLVIESCGKFPHPSH